MHIKTLKEFAEKMKETTREKWPERETFIICFGSQNPLRGIEAMVVENGTSPPEKELAKKVSNPMLIECHPKYNMNVDHYLIRIMDVEGIRTAIDFVAENKDLARVSCGDNGAGGYTFVLPSSISGTTLRVYHDDLEY